MGSGGHLVRGAFAVLRGTVQPKLDLIAQALTKTWAGGFGPDVTIAFPECSPRNQDQRRADDELDRRRASGRSMRSGGAGLSAVQRPEVRQPMVPNVSGFILTSGRSQAKA